MKSVDGSYATDVFFDKSPTPKELRAVRPLLEEVCRRGEDVEQALPDQLGTVYVGHTSPGVVTLDYHGRPYRPGLGTITAVMGEKTHRHVAVRVPFFDERAHHFLAIESGQLPDDSPGLIMIQMSEATGGMKKWAPTLQEELRLDMYRNVSAVCLFALTLVGSERGEAEHLEVVRVENPDAEHPLPEWADARLRQHTSSG